MITGYIAGSYAERQETAVQTPSLKPSGNKEIFTQMPAPVIKSVEQYDPLVPKAGDGDRFRIYEVRANATEKLCPGAFLEHYSAKRFEITREVFPDEFFPTALDFCLSGPLSFVHEKNVAPLVAHPDFPETLLVALQNHSSRYVQSGLRKVG